MKVLACVVDVVPCPPKDQVWVDSDVAFASQNPFALSVEDGALIAGAIVSLWLMAFVFAALRQMLGGQDDPTFRD